ncbi:MAG: hypothetical protein ACJA2Q_001870 [Pseudohongiellaceae bacterium]|jgi:hypothetical protein
MLEPFALAIVDSSLTQWIQANYWLWPILEIAHFMGLSLLIGGLLIVDLNLVGLLQLRQSATHKLLPIVVIGFGINLVTGILFFYGEPMRYAVNIGFQIKMCLICLAGLNALFYHYKMGPLMADWNSASPPPLAKLIAVTSLTAWTGVLLFGRLIPYVGTG